MLYGRVWQEMLAITDFVAAHDFHRENAPAYFLAVAGWPGLSDHISHLIHSSRGVTGHYEP